jgi:hypothetical protein
MRQDLVFPADVRGMIKILTALGVAPVAVVLEDYDLYQLPRPANKEVNLAEQDADVPKAFALVAFEDVVCKVSELWKIVKRTDLGNDAEVRAAWLVRQILPQIDTMEEFRQMVLSQPKFREPYTAALAAALKG